jgi:signal transduction histidine kinase
MPLKSLKLHVDAIFCFALLFWAKSSTAISAGPVISNQPAALMVESQASVLTTAAQVHYLTRKDAGNHQRVLIRGVITCALNDLKGAVVQDATGGIYVDLWSATNTVTLQMGDVVEVKGVADPGDFAPRVQAARVTRVGPGELPAPVRPYWDQLINGSLDTQFVEIEGVVTAMSADGATLLTHGGMVNVKLFGMNIPTNDVALKQYEGALIRLRGCLFASWDPATHQVKVGDIRMFAPALMIDERAPADAFAGTPKSEPDLLRFDPQASTLRRVKVTGQIIHESENEYFAMDGTNGFRFIPHKATRLAIGDLVEVAGFPSLTGPSPVLQEASARKTGEAPLRYARPLEVDNLFQAGNDATRVSVEAVLLNLSADQRTLELQAGLRRFVARLDDENNPDTNQTAANNAKPAHSITLPLGSRLQLTGVYAGQGGNQTTGMEVSNFELLLNSPADIVVLARPSFWTLGRLLVLVGALLCVLGLALIWIRLLHHKVQKRTAQLQKEMHIREQAENQRSLAQERARIARDLHDDLGSSLTEITMLATASPALKFPAEEIAERMETIAVKSRTLVNALDEIVWVVDPERDNLGSVARYLASYTEEFLKGLKIACRVQIPNSFPEREVSGEVRHDLFLAVKEALNNAIRHGGATEIEFRVRVLDDRLQISITDNGSGFEASGLSTGRGLLNLRNRMERLHGQCELQSSPGAGATVTLELPLPASPSLP